MISCFPPFWFAFEELKISKSWLQTIQHKYLHHRHNHYHPQQHIIILSLYVVVIMMIMIKVANVGEGQRGNEKRETNFVTRIPHVCLCCLGTRSSSSHHHHQNNLRNKYHNSDLDSFQMTSPMVLQLAMTRGYAVCGAPLSATICILCTEVALNTGLFTNFERKAGNIIMKKYWPRSQHDFVQVLVTLDQTGNFLCFVENTLGRSTWYFVLILLY